MYSSTVTVLATFAISVAPVLGHSWIEQLTVIDSTGSFTGNPGYARNNSLRTSPGFTDLEMVHILPSDGAPTLEQRDVDTTNVKPTDPMCKKTQQTQFQSQNSARLSAAAGSMVALRYEENGHVTLPQNQPGKPANRGNVYIYGTTQPKENDIFLDIFKVWNTDGTGGDKRGKLLATQPFDDGRCYQVNSGSISQQRQQQYPHAADKTTGTDLWCQNDIEIPSDAPSGKPYTLYWVWDWPTEPNVDPNVPKGKAEIYTSCLDIDITAAAQPRSIKEVRDAPAQDINNAAIPAYVSSLKNQPTAPAASQPSAPAASSKSAPPAAVVAPQGSNGQVSEIAASGTEQSPRTKAAEAVTTVTVTQPAQTGYLSAGAASNTQAAQDPSQSSAAIAATQPSYTIPTSLNIQPPLMSLHPPYPSAAGVSFTGTATPVIPAKSTTPSVVARAACPSCRAIKRSRILGSAAHAH